MIDTAEPKLSLLVPTYNYARFIGEALDSVLDQAVEGMEVLVVDDGSTDETETVLHPYLETGRVRYLPQANQGVSAARNHAMSQARGKWLMFLDADDTLHRGCLAATLDFLERHPDVGFFFTNYDLFDENGVVYESGVDTWKMFRSLPHEKAAADEWVFTESLAPHIVRHGGFMHTSGLTVRRDVAEAAGPFREGYTYGEDDDFYARAAHRTTSGYLDRVLSRKRNHEGSIIHDASRTLRNARHQLELTELQLDDYPDDARMQAILRAKHRRLSVGYCWALIERGEMGEAWPRLRAALRRYPGHLPLYKLLGKAVLAARG